MSSSSENRASIPWALSIIMFGLGLMIAWQATAWSAWSVEMEAEKSGVLKWYVDSGDGFSENEGAYASVPGGKRGFVEVWLPAGDPVALRLDPIDNDGEVRIYRIRWQEPWPGESGELIPTDADWSGVSIAELGSEGSWRLVPSPGTSDTAGVWFEFGGHSAVWWWAFRTAVALVFGVFAGVFGYWWNLRVLASRLSKRNGGGS